VKDKSNYVLMGLFVLVLGFVFIAGILWLGAGGSGRGYDEYLVYMQESVSGLSRDNVVKYQGVDVGQVREIGFDPQRVGEVRLLLQLDKGTPVRQDTVATLEMQGLTGLAFINLTGGDADSPMLMAKPGEDYPVIASRRSTWGRLDRSVEELVANLTEATELLKRLLSDENLRHLSNSLQNIDELTAALGGRSERMVEAIDDLAETVRHTREGAAKLPDTVEQLRQGAIMLEQMADQIRVTGAGIDEVVRARDRDLQRFTGEALPEASMLISDLRQAAGNLRRLSEQLERDPAVILRGSTRPLGPGE
jgi:phospholipid/cholesterol/gamma-HCH transport system substrate-binding protein